MWYRFTIKTPVKSQIKMAQRIEEALVYDSLDPRQRIVHYDDKESTKNQLVFIHGGAWRDPNNTEHDIDTLTKYLPQDIPIWSIDYRMSPKVKHPVHEKDVTAGLSKLGSLMDNGQLPHRKVNLVGHSAGASLALGVFDQNLGLHIENIVLLDGIYSLEELIEEYPSYQGFVDEAFDDYRKIDFLKNKNFEKVKIHIIQSHNDELLSKRQTQWLTNQFDARGIDYTVIYGDFGKHEDVYKHKRVATYIQSLYL